MPTLHAKNDRVIHRNAYRSYGHGRFISIVRPLTGSPSKGYVRFDGETADRLVWLDDLAPEPKALASSPRPTVRVIGGGAEASWSVEVAR